jgi:RecG-like helicase
VLTPVYPSTAGVSQAYLRKAIENAVERTPLPELLPPEIERDYPAARRADAASPCACCITPASIPTRRR